MSQLMKSMVDAISIHFGTKVFTVNDLQSAIEKSENLARPCRAYFKELLAPQFPITDDAPPTEYLSELEVLAHDAAGLAGAGVIGRRLACHTSGEVLPIIFHVVDPEHPGLYENLLSCGVVSLEALEEVCRNSGASWVQFLLRQIPDHVQAIQGWNEFQKALFDSLADRPSKDDLARANARIADLEKRLYWESNGRREAERKREASE